MCSAPARRVVLVAIALSVLACSRTDPGISREKAEAILRAFDFTDIELQPSPENGRRSGKEGQMLHYYAIAERGSRTTWWISFPGRDGITSAADDAGQIVVQAQDALASAAMYGRRLPPAIEDGATPPTDLSEFDQPAMVVVIPFAAPEVVFEGLRHHHSDELEAVR